MTIHEAIQQRHSLRRYADRPIEAEKVAALRALIEQCNCESGLNMQLVTDEPTAFNCRMARYGRFSGVSNYFALIGRADEPNLDEIIAIADKLIGSYSAAFPKKNDAFMLDLIDGHTYVVPGWIGKSTIIRTR